MAWGCFQIYPTSCSDCLWLNSTQCMYTSHPIPRVDDYPQRSILGSLSLQFSLLSLWLFYHFAYIINLSSFSTTRSLFFFLTPLGMKASILWPNYNQLPQAELLLEWQPVSIHWHWVGVATIGFLSLLPLLVTWTSALKVSQGRGIRGPSILGSICLGKNFHHISVMSGEWRLSLIKCVPAWNRVSATGSWDSKWDIQAACPS